MLYQQSEYAGRSVQDRTIALYLFGRGSPLSSIETLFIGVFHGDEGISGDLLKQFITHLETAYPFDETVSFGIIPVLNPDGYAAETRINANGVDLNRNYPTRNWQKEPKDSPYYSGESPASEPETRWLLDILAHFLPRKIVTVHAPYKVVNYDGPAKWLAEAMAKKNGYPVVSDIGYPTPGSFGTYMGIERQVPVITLELPEDEPLEKVWLDNQDALLTAITAQP